VTYRDVPVEVDTIPLHLLDRDPAALRSLGEIVVAREELLRRFAALVSAVQPALWRRSTCPSPNRSRRSSIAKPPGP
jgi:hypothetical protein